MKVIIGCWALCLAASVAGVANAADVEAGKAKVATVCAACHGLNGVSVADDVPNLAGQRARYLTAQLTALKAGTRKSDIMNVVAGQLSADDIANVVAYFSTLSGPVGSEKSSFLPNLAKTSVSIPADYKAGFAKYWTQNDAESKQVKLYYANDKAVAAAAAGKALPDGSAIFIEVYSAKLDADKRPLSDADGNLMPDRLLAYTGMARDAGWGKDIPEILRNEDWNYAVFTADRQPRSNINQAECFACHKPQSEASYVFTLKQLAALRK